MCLADSITGMFKNSGQEGKIAEVFLEGMESYVHKHQQFPDKYGLNLDQKARLLETLWVVGGALGGD